MVTYDGVGCHRHDRVKSAGGERILKIAQIIGQKRMNQGQIGTQCGFQKIGFPIHRNLLFAFLTER